MRSRLTNVVSTWIPPTSILVRGWRPQWICRHRVRRQSQRMAHLSTTTTDDPTKPFYITSPIFNVNAAPDVGHMYSMVLADVLKRWHRLKHRPALLSTGTAEHGLKVQQAAAKADLDNKGFCDSGTEVFKELAVRSDISNDIFTRTTEQRHKEAVRYAWQMLEKQDHIYMSRRLHESFYSVEDEAFYRRDQVQLIVDPPTGRKIMVSIETGNEVEWTTEKVYLFRLSHFRDRLLDFYKRNPDFLVPKGRMDDIMREVENGLEDISFSRPAPKVKWAVRVPNDSSQSIDVWLDALLSYITAVGYPFTPGLQSSWPADVQVIGTDIARFHCILWPALLMALDLPLPKQILVHAHWTLGREKMSKITGNVVNPFFALERFGLDTLRWFLIYDGGIAQSHDYDNRYVIARYEKHLKDGLGNLTSRITRFKGWDVARAVKRFAGASFEPTDSHSRVLCGKLKSLSYRVDKCMQDLLPNQALKTIMDAVHDTNAHMQNTSPFKLARELPSYESNATRRKPFSKSEVKPGSQADTDELDRLIYLDAEALRLVGIMLQSFIPDAANRLLDMLGVQPERRNWDWCNFGKDAEYGVSLVEMVKGEEGLLFPGLTSAF